MGALSDFVKGRTAVALLSLSVGGASAIVGYEGMRPAAYRDGGGVVTVCAGHTRTAKMGQVKTPRECYALLAEDSKEAQDVVRRLVKVKLTQAQFDALTSFVFNFGETKFAASTLLRRINAGQCLAAGNEFPRWNQDNGVVQRGLVKRRAAERDQWMTGCVNAPT